MLRHPAGALCIVAVVLQPYAGIQDVAQQVGVLHTGRRSKTFGTACQQQLKKFPASLPRSRAARSWF